MLRRALFAVAALLLPASAMGQVLRGVVVDRSDRPVAGVVLLLMANETDVAARSLSNERGEFRLAATSAGAYRVRTMRIGFRPVVSEPVLLAANADVVQRLVLSGVAFSLDTVRVVGQNACRAVSDEGAATFAVFEQVRTAITATQITGSGRSVAMTKLTYEQSLDPSSRRVKKQAITVRTEFGAQPWLSIAPDSLRRMGYVVNDADGGVTYHAPGLDMLLSNVFVEDHCFKLVSDKDRLGIEFEPTRDRKRIPEIRGTLWLDRASSELRSLELGYVNVDQSQERVAGSSMEFVRMKNGAWAISRWNIRMPLLEQRVRSRAVGGTGIFLSEVRVAGGDLVLARAGRDTLWAQPPRVLEGVVVDSVSGAWVVGAEVALEGTQLFGSTDEHGAFKIAGVLPGEYTLDIHTPSLDSASAVHQTPLTFTDASVKHVVHVPTAQQVASMICKDPSVYAGIVMGSVRVRGDTLAPRNARVIAEWDVVSARQNAAGTQIETNSRTRETRSDARGSFRLCGIPIATTLSIRVEAESGSADPLELRIPPAGRFARAEFTLDRMLPGLAVFTGVVVADSTKLPIAGADVRFAGLGKSVVTNERGVFRIPLIPPGTHQLVVRRIGYGPVETPLSFAAGQTIEKQIVLSRAVVLDTMAVVERAVLPGFDEHKKLGLGHFFTRDVIAAREGMQLATILSETPGLGLVRGRGGQAWILGKHSTSGGVYHPERFEIMQGMQSACFAQVYVDRTLMNPERPTQPFDVNTISPTQIEAVEFYSGPSQTPLEYSKLHSSCGVLVIWTRRER